MGHDANAIVRAVVRQLRNQKIPFELVAVVLGIAVIDRVPVHVPPHTRIFFGPGHHNAKTVYHLVAIGVVFVEVGVAYGGSARLDNRLHKRTLIGARRCHIDINLHGDHVERRPKNIIRRYLEVVTNAAVMGVLGIAFLVALVVVSSDLGIREGALIGAVVRGHQKNGESYFPLGKGERFGAVHHGHRRLLRRHLVVQPEPFHKALLLVGVSIWMLFAMPSEHLVKILGFQERRRLYGTGIHILRLKFRRFRILVGKLPKTVLVLQNQVTIGSRLIMVVFVPVFKDRDYAAIRLLF